MSRPLTPTGLTRSELTRLVARHRALLAAGLAAGSVAAALGVLAPAPPQGVAALRLLRDLPAGAALTAADVARVQLPAAAVPRGALQGPADAVGRLLAAPVRAGEVLTDVRLAGAGLLGDEPAGRVAVPVRLADAATAGLLRPGDRIDVLAAATGPAGQPPGAAVPVATAALVLAVPTARDAAEGALVVVAATPAVAARLAAAAVTSRLSFALRGPP